MSPNNNGLVWTIIIAAVVNLITTVVAQRWTRKTSQTLANNQLEDERRQKLVDVFVSLKTSVDDWDRGLSEMAYSIMHNPDNFEKLFKPTPGMYQLKTPKEARISLVESISRLHLMVNDVRVKRLADQLLTLVNADALTTALYDLGRNADDPPEEKQPFAAQVEDYIAQVRTVSLDLMACGESALGYDLPGKHRRRKLL